MKPIVLFVLALLASTTCSNASIYFKRKWLGHYFGTATEANSHLFSSNFRLWIFQKSIRTYTANPDFRATFSIGDTYIDHIPHADWQQYGKHSISHKAASGTGSFHISDRSFHYEMQMNPIRSLDSHYVLTATYRLDGRRLSGIVKTYRNGKIFVHHVTCMRRK